MNASASALTPADLEAALRGADPGALLVPPRILRRVVKTDRQVGGLGLQVPHSQSYVLPSRDLLDIAGRGELGLAPGQILPDVVVLLPRPDARALASRPREETLRTYSRLLFHGHVHRALRDARAAGRLTEEGVRERVGALGALELEEARAVLRQERLLLPPADLVEAYEEFAAVFLELRHFDARRLPRYFPSMLDLPAVEAVLARDVDAAALLARTRLTGADGSADAPEEAPPAEGPEPEGAAKPDGAEYAALRAQAARAAARGNAVRAVLLRARAVRCATAGQARFAREEVRQEVAHLAARLLKALGLPRREKADWEEGLAALVGRAAAGTWNVEGRLLYDLQKVCVDHERGFFAADLVEWFVSGFRRPVKRPLPHQPLVLAVKHLRLAGKRLTAARLPADVRARFTERLHAAVHHAEARLRDALRPHLVGALDKVGLLPRNYAERVARAKLTEELLDKVVAAGFLTIGDLRDGLARNRMKLPDLRGPVEFARGDPLLRANARLAYDLDGVYRRGEIYLRWLQRLSSLFFGTVVGRLLTLYLLLPLGGAFFVLRGVDALAEELHKFLGLPEVHTFNYYSFGALALFLLLLFHVPPFRRAVWASLRHAWRGTRAAFYDLPAWLLRLPVVRLVLSSRTFVLFFQYVGKPLLVAAPVGLALRLAGADPRTTLAVAGALLALTSVVLNTRLGLLAEEAVTDRAVRAWQLVRDDILPGVFRLIMYVSRAVLEWVNRCLYSVDELLRFRTGQGRLTFLAKLALGFVWFWVTYVVRFVVNLLVEPQVNPLKHFPVVTVSHKLMLALVEPIATAVHPWLSARYPAWHLTKAKTIGLVTFSLGLVPGVFGFLAWELKENWRLYWANQSPTLDPVMVGSHGETVIRLLRPGFHSGTLPKLFAKWRRARGRSARRAEDGLHHVAEDVRHFAERELLAVLAGSRCWGLDASVGEVRLGCSRIRLELCCPGLTSALLDFENHAGRLVAGFARAGWVAALPGERRAAFRDALAGFYKLAGVELVREQLAAALPAGAAWEVAAEGLVVRVGQEATVYGLDDARPAPEVLLLKRRPVTWDEWVEAWEQDQAGKGHGDGLLPGVRLLPAGVG